MLKRKKLNLGYSDFKNTILDNNYFVDKSMLIEEVINAEKAVLLLPRPRRFGKTLNLSMLKHFFIHNEPENYKLFTDLKIWQTDEEIKKHQGKYPVIYLTFKDVKEDNWEDCLKSITNEIAYLYRNFEYLVNEDFLSEDEKIEFINIKGKKADKTEYQESIKKLSNYLYRYHNQKVVILIDEYDAPIQAGYNKFYDKVIAFMRNLLSGAFKDNDFIFKGVITGILRVSKESIFSGLNNISVYTILDNQFSDKFGFTETETKQILTDLEVETDYNEIKIWYDGYKIGNTTDIYNPWSILNYAVSWKEGFKTFWVNTSADNLLKDRINERDANETRELLLKLVNNETIEKSIEENFVFPDLDKKKDLLWTLLTFSGYLTAVKKTNRKSFELSIPNYEIKTVFQDIILDWLNVEVKLKQNLLIETTKYLINNEIDKFEKGFKQIIGDTFSYYDINGEPEKVYQSYVLGLLAIIGDDYIIKSNRESGEGRYDIMLIPHDKTKYGIVIEIKQITRNTNDDDKQFLTKVENKIKEAKNQIEENQYYKELIDNKITNIIKLPIVFCGKTPYIKL